MTVEQILEEMARNGYPIIEIWVEPLISAGFGGLPVLVRRNLGREVVRLEELKAHLAKPLGNGDHLRDVSTWPQAITAIKSGAKYPLVTRRYFL